MPCKKASKERTNESMPKNRKWKRTIKIHKLSIATTRLSLFIMNDGSGEEGAIGPRKKSTGITIPLFRSKGACSSWWRSMNRHSLYRCCKLDYTLQPTCISPFRQRANGLLSTRPGPTGLGSISENWFQFHSIPLIVCGLASSLVGKICSSSPCLFTRFEFVVIATNWAWDGVSVQLQTEKWERRKEKREQL